MKSSSFLSPCDSKLVCSDYAYFHPDTLEKLADKQRFIMLEAIKGNLILPIKSNTSHEEGKIGLNLFQRLKLGLSRGDTLRYKFADESYFAKVKKAVFEIGIFGGTPEEIIQIDVSELTSVFTKKFSGHPLNIGHCVVLKRGECSLTFDLTKLHSRERHDITVALLDENEPYKLKFSIRENLEKFLFLSDKSKKSISEINFNFHEMGVGGLSAQLNDLIERAFLFRSMPVGAADMYGVKHAKGILLYGPPGTGKSLIAKTIANMFENKKIKIVSGPELLNRCVGQTEENLNCLFEEAEEEWELKGKESDLYVLFFDQIDTLCRGSSGSNDTANVLVNQLLTKLDGDGQLENVLIIGITNRKDLMDEALIHRMGIHIKIDLPDEVGRLEIIKIHMKELIENNLLEEVDLQEWARKTVNFTGADIEEWIQEARCIANSRNFEIKDGTKPIFKSFLNDQLAKVSQKDLKDAFRKISVAYGTSLGKLEPYLRFPFFTYNKSISEMIEAFERDVLTIKEVSNVPTRSFLLSGNKGVGKTALSIHLAVASHAPFVSLITSGDLAGASELERIEKLDAEFKKTFQSRFSVIILDNIEGILGATRDGRTYLTQTVLKLEALLSDPSYSNLLVLATSSYVDFLDKIDMLSSFKHFKLEELSSYEEVYSILKKLNLGKEKTSLSGYLPSTISIRKLMEKIQTFKALHKEELWDTNLFLKASFN